MWSNVNIWGIWVDGLWKFFESLSVKGFSFSAVSRTVSKLKQKALVKKKHRHLKEKKEEP